MSSRAPLQVLRGASRFRQQSWALQSLPTLVNRPYASSTKQPQTDGTAQHDSEKKGPNMDQLPHVSEEAAALSKIQGQQGPQIEQQGIPVEEVVKGDKEAEANLPKVMKDALSKGRPTMSRKFSTSTRGNHKSSRYFSTTCRSAQNDLLDKSMESSLMSAGLIDFDVDEVGESVKGLKFGEVNNLGPRSHLQDRYDPLVDQVTKLLMRDGKLATAQKNMSIILSHLATSPTPRPSLSHPILLANMSPAQLPLNPLFYLSVAIDSVAPLVRIRAVKGAAGGGSALQLPTPLKERQRRRAAVMWVLDQVDKKKGSVSPFAKRFAEELVAIVEGRSSVWERRNAVHVLGIRARANIGARIHVKRRKKL